jgi:hypothetical protein
MLDSLGSYMHMPEHTFIPYCCHSEDEGVELEIFDGVFQNFLNIGSFV